MDLSRPLPTAVRLDAGELWVELSDLEELRMGGPQVGRLRTSTGFERGLVLPGPKLSVDGRRLAFVELRQPSRASHALACYAVVVDPVSNRCLFESGPYAVAWIAEVTATGVALVDFLAGVGTVIEFDFDLE